MKKLTILTLIMFLTSMISVMAGPSPPDPVTLKLRVNGEPYGVPDVRVTNLATGEVLTKDEVPQLDMSKGISAFLMSSFEQGYDGPNLRLGYPGDEIEVKMCELSPQCTFTFYAAYTNPIDFTFNIDIIDDTIPPQFVCWDNSVVTSSDDCPFQPIPQPEYVCWDESVVSEASQCPEEIVDGCPEEPDSNTLAMVLTALFGAAVGGTGIYFFKKREAAVKGTGLKTYVSTDGKIKVLHKHPGIRGYHNPSTSHRVLHEKHPRGEYTPLYEKDVNGVYKYVK